MATTVSGSLDRPVLRVDANGLRTNQACIVGFVVLAFVLGSDIGAWVVAAVALSLAIGAGRPGSGPFQLVYKRLILPSGLLRPDVRPEDPAAPRFAQAMGAAVLALAAALLFAGAAALGWALAWVVVALALVNLLFGFCAGCFIFLQLRRAGVVR